MGIENALFAESGNPFAAPASDGGDEGASAPEGKNQSRYDKRIAQLTKQRSDAQRALTDTLAEVSQLKAEVEQLRGSVSRDNTVAGQDFVDFGSLKDTQLAQILQENAHDPAVAIRTNKLLAKRQIEEALQEYDRRKQEEATQHGSMQQMANLIAQTFGADEVNNPRSPLRQRVEQVGGILAGQYGAERFQKDPVALFGLFAEGGRQLAAERMANLTKEVEELRAKVKNQASIDGAVAAAASRSTEMKDALAKGDVKGAVSQLRFTKFLKGENVQPE